MCVYNSDNSTDINIGAASNDKPGSDENAKHLASVVRVNLQKLFNGRMKFKIATHSMYLDN